MNSQSKSVNTEPETNSVSKSTSRQFGKIDSLRSRLLISVLPVVLIPFIIASVIGYLTIERRAKNQILTEFENHALLASSTISTFIHNSFEVMDMVAVDPEMIEAMKVGSNQALEQKLTQQSIPDLEKKFATNKLLTINTKLNNHLKQIVKSGRVAEIFLTERNGFNVAYSNPTSDFVQRDEDWWQISYEEGWGADEPEFDESANALVIPFSQAVKDPQTGEFIGVIKAARPISRLVSELNTQLGKLNDSRLQIVDPDESFVLYDSKQEVAENDQDNRDHFQDDDNEAQKSIKVMGGKAIVEVIETLIDVEGNSLSLEALEEAEESTITFISLEQAKKIIEDKPEFSEVYLQQKEIFSEISTIASFRYQNHIYTLSTVPKTDFVSINIANYDIVAAEAKKLLIAFIVATVALGSISVGSIVLLAQQIARPLTRLSTTAQKVAAGNLAIEAELEGTLETRTLASNFNTLVKKVKESLESQKTAVEQQRLEKEKLEVAIYTLLDEVADATDGDLTVRANLDSMEMSTVADLFNAIITNLQDIAIEAKRSSNQVGSYLKQNEEVILVLAEHALAEAKETRETLTFVEKMSQSIQAVAANANQAEQIADDTYNTVLDSSSNMDLTVDSILALRNTVGETSKKMKRLGESSQKISQVVSFIEEIAIKTNVLAINASVEAGRAGEYGEGFTIVAEQVGALAEQSATATREIAKIVAAIQAETLEVNQAMESGTTQVVETTRIVESTKQSLGIVLEKSQKINQLMESISQTTVSQADTSQNVTNLMHKISEMSETTSRSSQQVAQSIVATAEVAAKLESTVAQFKVAEST